jgi:transposase
MENVPFALFVRPLGAAIMSLIQSAKLNGQDPYAYLKDVLTRLPTQRNSMIGELLPHRWTPPTTPA